MSDLTPGMELRGTVLNVVDFGAFVDVGLKESGLVHVSEMSAQFVRSPHDVVSVGDVVTVWVLSVDVERKRVSLGMIKPGTPIVARSRRPEQKPAVASPARSDAAGKVESSVAAPAPPSSPQSTTQAQEANGQPLAPAAAVKPPAQGRPLSKPPYAKPPVPKRPAPAKPERKSPPLSTGALTGEEPLRTFGQLKQFWNKKDT